jgi:enamine deaminase RidA (YjgF/YER057c/UK114 family)
MIGERVYSGHPNEEKVGYARAAVVDGWVFVSGTTGFDAETKTWWRSARTASAISTAR